MRAMMMPERSVEGHFAPDELEVLDQILRALNARGPLAAQDRHRTADLLQTESGRGLCRQVMQLRDVLRGVAPPIPIVDEPGEVEHFTARTDWPSGECLV